MKSRRAGSMEPPLHEPVGDAGREQNSPDNPDSTAISAGESGNGPPQRVTPIKSIRRKCVDCSGGLKGEVRGCQITACELHPYRMGKRPPPGTAERTPMRAMRAYCLSCCRGQTKEVRLCPCKDCELWPYRMGKRRAAVTKEVGLRPGVGRSGEDRDV